MLTIVVNGRTAADRSAELILKVRMLEMKNVSIKILVIADKILSEQKVRIMDYGADELTVKPLSVE